MENERSLVIIPTYNEIENITDMVHKVMSLGPIKFHLLIVDDGSPDGTAQEVKNLQSQYKRLHLLERTEKSGLGTAYIAGFKWGLERNFEYLFEMDCDFSHNPQDLLKLAKACQEEGADLAIGSRYSQGVNVVNWPMSRVLLSYFASKYVRFITGLPIADSTAGFKCYRAIVLETLLREQVKFVGYAFQIEMKFKAWKYGFKVVEVPIVFTERERGQSKMSPKIVKEALLGVVELKVSSFFKSYRRS